jgi:uncharacterized protein DUF4396
MSEHPTRDPQDQHEQAHDHRPAPDHVHEHSSHGHGQNHSHDHAAVGHDHGAIGHDHGAVGLTRQAISATVHCLTGCAIGEILGMVLATWWGWSNGPSIVLSIVLAFAFGYSLTITPVLRAGVAPRTAVGVALAADTASITTMEIVDNAFLLIVPGAMAAGLSTGLFWSSLVLSLAIAFVITVPVNRALIARGKGHAVMHQYH